MNPKDIDWAIDTLCREEDILKEFKKYLRRATEHETAAAVDHMIRDLFSVRQLLEHERALLQRLRGEP